MADSESSFITVSRRGSMRDRDPEYTVVWVRGEHDTATKASLAFAITRAAQRDDANVLVDLSGVTFMDASTIGAIVGSRSRLRSRSQSLEVRAPSPFARRVLELCELTHLVHSSPVEAVNPTGAAAALSTWVDVPSIQGDREIDSDAEEPAPSEEFHLADARRSSAGAMIDVDRGGP